MHFAFIYLRILTQANSCHLFSIFITNYLFWHFNLLQFITISNVILNSKFLNWSEIFYIRLFIICISIRDALFWDHRISLFFRSRTRALDAKCCCYFFGGDEIYAQSHFSRRSKGRKRFARRFSERGKKRLSRVKSWPGAQFLAQFLHIHLRQFNDENTRLCYTMSDIVRGWRVLCFINNFWKFHFDKKIN